MGLLILEIIKALLEALKEYQKEQRLLAESKKNAEDMKSIDQSFEVQDAKTLNDIFMHRLNDRVSKSPAKGDKV